MENTIAQLLAQNAQMNAKLDVICGKLPKIDEIDAKMEGLLAENAALRQELVKRDETIQQLTNQVNKLDQDSRSTSLRILGLPITSATTPPAITEIVFKQIIQPCLETAIRYGDLPEAANFPIHLLISRCIPLPAKKDNPSCPVIVKLASEIVRNLIFKHKKEALPTVPDPTSNRIRNKFSIFEDLTSKNHSILRSLADDPRVRSVWSFSGQIRFKSHDSETIYKVKNPTDTYDSIVVHPPIPARPSTTGGST